MLDASAVPASRSGTMTADPPTDPSRQGAITERDGAVRISVRVKPRASRTKILGEREGALEIAVSAPPVEGAANEAVRDILAKTLAVPKSAIVIVTGASGWNKVIEASGVDRQTATRKLFGESA